ncbi:MAG: hypothetical protein LBB57_05235, partial [Clostridiales Family XIII bacterium]|nr:hypothetical protein [Clostridiales Family XIII bacterium]
VPRDDADDTNTFDDSTTSGPRERTDAVPAPEAVLADAASEELAPEAEVAAPAADEFRWNVHSFPSVELRKTEDVNFDWNLPPAFLVQREVSSLGGETEANDGAYAAKEAPIAESMEAFFERCANCESQGAGEADGFQFAMPNAGGDVLAPALPGAETAPESLGNTLGPSAGKSNRERFFTFDRKNEEFQKLLDREYERLQSYNSPII